MKNFVQPGDVVTLTAPVGGLQSGDGVLVGALFGVAAYDASEGAEVECRLVGVFDLPKASGAIDEGEAVYWDDSAGNVTTTATDNTLIGAAIRAADSGAATTRVRLNGITA